MVVDMRGIAVIVFTELPQKKKPIEQRQMNITKSHKQWHTFARTLEYICIWK